MMVTLYWIMFFMLSIITLGLFIGYFGLLASTDKGETGAPFVIVITTLFAALLFFPAREIFSMSTSVLMWKITNVILILISLLVLVLNYDKKEEVNGHTVGFIITAAIGIAPFIQNIKENKSTEVVLIGKTYIELILLGSSILIITFAIFLYVIKYIRTKNRIIQRQNAALARFSNTNFDELNEFNIYYSKMVREDINNYLYRTNKEISNLVKLIQESNKSRPTANKELHSDDEISQILNDIVDIKTSLQNSEIQINPKSTEQQVTPSSNHKVDEIRFQPSTNFDISKELKHFLATPFSSIIVKTKLIRSSDPKNIGKHLDQIVDYITMCKSVISTYVNVSNLIDNDELSGKSFDTMSKKAFELYQTEFEKPQLKFNTNNIPDCISNIPNDYLLCIFLPLIQNAVAAAPDSSQITLNYDASTFTLTNECEGPAPSLENLNTSGYSSKKDHQGSGIMIARGLVNRNKTGQLSYEIAKNKIILKLQINDKDTRKQ